MKNKLILTIMFLALLFQPPVLAENPAESPEQDTVRIEETSNELTNTLDEEAVEQADDVTIKQENNGLPYKEPISKRKLAKKFLLAMFSVGVSSLILYFGLTVYNRIREGGPVKVKTLEGETPLTEPSDLESAVKTFLKKTKWK